MEDRLFDFEEIWYLFKRRWWIIVVITVMTTSLAVFKVSKLQPTYSASAKIYIGKGNEILQYYSSQELAYYSQFVTIFSEISKIDGFFDETFKANNIKMSSLGVASSLNFSASQNTPLYTVSYSSWTDEDIEKILDAVCGDIVVKVKEIMPETNPSILSKARVMTIYPDKKRLPIIAFAAGVIVSIALILVLDYLDDKVRSKKELEKILPIPVLGDIPTHEKNFEKEEKDVHSKQNAQVGFSRSI